MPVPLRFILRELTVLALVAAMWRLEATTVDQVGAFARLIQISTGLITLVPAALLHEWGHLAGAKLTRSVVHFPDRLFAPLLFDFDIERNDRTQFLAMSLGGYLGSAVGVLVLWTSLPAGRLASWIALAGAALGMIVSLLIEMPHTLKAWRGEPLPKPLVTVTKRR